MTKLKTYSFKDRDRDDHMVVLFSKAKAKFIFREEFELTGYHYFYLTRANALRMLRYMCGDKSKLPVNGFETFLGKEGDYDMWLSWDDNPGVRELSCKGITGNSMPRGIALEVKFCPRG